MTRLREDTMAKLFWTLQVLLAVAFFAHGWMFLYPPPEIAVLMDASLARGFQVFLGVAEVAAAVGLTLPSLTRILPAATVWAACGVMIVTVSATIWHTARGEYSSAATTLVLLGLAATVAWGRLRVAPIAARWPHGETPVSSEDTCVTTC